MNYAFEQHNSISGELSGDDMRIAIIHARFNQPITELLLKGAYEGLTRHNVDPARIALFGVQGPFELALAAQNQARGKKYDGIIAIGAIIRGETAHVDLVAGQTASGIAATMRAENIPIIFCVLTTDTVEQALQRSGIKSGNRGWTAAMNVIGMVNLLRRLASDA